MDGSIRVALVNDYELVLEGLRALLRPYSPGIRVVELDVRTTPDRTVDVTFFDTYGETGALQERVRELASDAANGAVVVFSFSNDAALANGVMRAGARGFISKASPAAQIVDGIRKAARGEQVMSLKRSQRATIIPELGWPGRAVKLTERESELLALLNDQPPTRQTPVPQREHNQVAVAQPVLQTRRREPRPSGGPGAGRHSRASTRAGSRHQRSGTATPRRERMTGKAAARRPLVRHSFRIFARRAHLLRVANTASLSRRRAT
jgi:DNA-binding NarL/FixJ family response regulator